MGALVALVTGLLSPAGAVVGNDGPSPEPPDLSGRYVVVMEEEPLVIQFGRDGVDSAEARNKGRAMKAGHAEVLNGAGVDASAVIYDYTAALNGFAVELDETQLTRVQSADGVMMVVPEVFKFPQTDSSPDFLGLTGDTGAHDQQVNGEGVVVGIIDSGIWPEHPSFADDGSYNRPPIEPSDDHGDTCSFGNTDHNPDDAPFECNNKLVGARHHTAAYKAIVGLDQDEFDSARDDQGHGTHTASTAAGNADIEATVLGRNLGEITGVAPRAHIVAYKACGTLGCAGSDLAAAIDQAVVDGVDVINFPIGSSTTALGPDDLAFLFATDAGVRVAASAGDSRGDGATGGSPAFVPWLTAVAASTQSRFFLGTVALGNGRFYNGASLTGPSDEAPLVDAADVGGDLCIPGTLDQAVVDGAIVLCRRGVIDRPDKSRAVAGVGGVGMVMYNQDDVGDLSPDSHAVPSVHVDLESGLAIKDYIASTASPTASIEASRLGMWPDAPTVAGFSPRGPNGSAGDIIKPDITAPGVQVLAGYSPMATGGTKGELFAALGGTSMSSSHVAGVFALLAQEHPHWSAGASKSAIMTTADQNVLDNDRISPADTFAMGSGHLDVGSPDRQGSAFQPGLVYEAGHLDHLGFVCDAFPDLFTDSAGTCGRLASLGVPTEAVDLNYPSIGIGALAGSRVITRTVTSVASDQVRRTYAVSVDAPEGYEVEVHPSNIRLKSGQSATYQVRITNVNAPFGVWRHGSLTWTSKEISVYSPIAVRGVSYAAPAAVTGRGETGMVSFPINFGYTGQYTAAVHGLEPATVFSDTVGQDGDQVFSPDDVTTGGAVLHEVATSGAALLRIALPPDAAESNIDLDIFVFGPAGNLVATSTAGGTNELIDLVLPADGTYSIFVHGWQAGVGGSDYDLHTWVVSATPGGNMTIDSAPASASVDATEDIAVSWTGAIGGQWHLGAVSHADGFGLMGLTLVEVDSR
jgi:subtilisin family serine protease